MSKMGIMENGYKRSANPRKKRRRRNPSATVARAKNPARRSVSLSSAKAVLKRNGLKAVSTMANGRKHKRRHKRRNGLATVPRRSNGFFGNTKGDAIQVAQLGVGALGTKALGRALAGFVGPLLAQVGMGGYVGIITDAGVALLIAPWVADKISRGSAKMVRLGGLLTVGLDVVEMFAPGALSFNPFNNAPIVATPGGLGVTPGAVAQIAADVANSANPQAAAAHVGGVMYQLDTAGAQGGGNQYAGQYDSAPELVL